MLVLTNFALASPFKPENKPPKRRLNYKLPVGCLCASEIPDKSQNIQKCEHKYAGPMDSLLPHCVSRSAELSEVYQRSRVNCYFEVY